MNLHVVIFGSTKAYRHLVSCERNSSYSFTRDLFETLQVLLSMSEDVHVIWSLKTYIQHISKSIIISGFKLGQMIENDVLVKFI